jgi:hypothetical protein
MATHQLLKFPEILREIETRRAYLDSEVERYRRYLRVVPGCREHSQLEHEILAAASASLELESLESAILGREQ